eukprot:4032053-Prymnesium_polylepis.1
MIARPHDGLALCAAVCASWLVRLLDRTLVPRLCPTTPPLSAQPAGGTGGGGRSAGSRLGVAVVSTRAHEYKALHKAQQDSCPKALSIL